MRYFFIDSIYGFLSENLFIFRLKIYINVTKKIAFLGLKNISVAEYVIIYIQMNELHAFFMKYVPGVISNYR